MRHTLFLMILLLSLSCTSRSQAKRDSIIDTLSDSLSDSIFSTDTLRLLFVGEDVYKRQLKQTEDNPLLELVHHPIHSHTDCIFHPFGQTRK